jgi:uncharacterized protein involved in exopolysaccharide biosynthesis
VTPNAVATRPTLLQGLWRVWHDGVKTEAVWARLRAARRRTIALTFGTAVLATAGALVMPKWYQSGAVLVVDTGQQLPSLSAMAGAAGMLGMASQAGLGSSNSAPASPLFYEALLKSRAVAERVVAASFPLGPHGEMMPLEQYWAHRDTLTPKQHFAALKKFSRHLHTTATPRTSQVEFKLEGPSILVSKLMADTALAALNDLIVEVHRRHATAEREFLEGRYQTLADSLNASEDALRHFYEQNRTLSSPALQFEDLRLRREIDRVQTVYSQIGLQLENARVQEVRDTPSLTVVDAPIEPVRKSAPIVKLWTVSAAILGGALALLLAMAEAATLEMQRLRLEPAALRRTEQG